MPSEVHPSLAWDSFQYRSKVDLQAYYRIVIRGLFVSCPTASAPLVRKRCDEREKTHAVSKCRWYAWRSMRRSAIGKLRPSREKHSCPALFLSRLPTHGAVSLLLPKRVAFCLRIPSGWRVLWYAYPPVLLSQLRMPIVFATLSTSPLVTERGSYVE